MVALYEEAFYVTQGHVDDESTKEEPTLTSRVGQFLAEQGGLAKERMSTLVELLVHPESQEQRTKLRFGTVDSEVRDEDVSPQSESGYSPNGLLSTMDKYHKSIGKPLTVAVSTLDQGFERLTRTVWGFEPSLSEAAYRGDVWLMRDIMNDSNINETEDELSNMTPLHLAARAGHLQAVKLLLQHPRVRVNARDSWNGTPFHAACAEGHLDVVHALLEGVTSPRLGNEVELNALNNFAQTAVDLARKHKRANIVALLDRLGAVDGETQIQALNEKTRKKRSEEFAARMRQEAQAESTWIDSAWMAVEKVVEENFQTNFD